MNNNLYNIIFFLTKPFDFNKLVMKFIVSNFYNNCSLKIIYIMFYFFMYKIFIFLTTFILASKICDMFCDFLKIIISLNNF